MSRVVIVNRFAPPDIAATAQLIGDLATALSRNFEVVAVGADLGYSDASTAAHAGVDGVESVRLGTSRFGRARLLGRAVDYLSFHVACAVWLLRNLRRGDIVVALTDPPLISVVAAMASKIRGAVLVNWLQDLFPEVAVRLGEPRIVRFLAVPLRALRDWSMRVAAANVAIGERMRDEVAARCIEVARISVIPNWAHEEAGRPAGEASGPDEAGRTGAFVVMYSGNLGRAHDAETLLDAAKRLRGRDDVKFRIVGGGHGNAWLREQAAKLGLANMQFEDYRPLEQLGELLAEGDLHLVSLRPELEGLILPSKFYGVAAAARPVAFIGDREGELASLIVRAHCGFVVAEGSGAELAAGIVDLAARPDDARAMGRRARELLDREFSRRAALQSWNNLLAGIHESPCLAPIQTPNRSTIES